MERLTIEYCGEYVPKDMCSIDRLGGADDCDLCCEYCKATEEGNEDCRGCAINQCFNKLGEYETLDEQGKLLKLPVAVGDRIYVVDTDERLPDEEIEVHNIDNIVIASDGTILLKYDAYDGVICELENIITDKPYHDFFRCFLSRGEAEAALKEMSKK